jgi:hypothetical protein
MSPKFGVRKVSYRNKTYVAFASEDIKYYWMMKAWRDNENIDFDFYNAHDLYVANDSSLPESIKAQLRERIKNAKQVVLLGSAAGRRKGGNGKSFLAYEVGAILRLNLPVVIANLDDDERVDTAFIPQPLLDADHYTMSVSFRAAIIKYALDDYASDFSKSTRSGQYHYAAETYQRLGLK